MERTGKPHAALHCRRRDARLAGCPQGLFCKLEWRNNYETYLVTGCAGFIGSNFVHYMLEKYDKDIRLVNLDKLTYAGNLENLKDIEDDARKPYLCKGRYLR